MKVFRYNLSLPLCCLVFGLLCIVNSGPARTLLSGSSLVSFCSQSSREKSINSSAVTLTKPPPESLEPILRRLAIFEMNRGQVPPEVKYLARNQNYNLFLTSSEVILSSYQGSYLSERQPRSLFKRYPQKGCVNPQPQFSSLRLKLAGSNPQSRIQGQNPLPGVHHYLIGDNLERWRANLPTYSKVRYEAIYPGIDMVFYNNGRQLEFDFIVAPFSSLQAIRINVKGAEQLKTSRSGDLSLITPAGEFKLLRPTVYQETDGIRRELKGRFVVLNHHQIGFQVQDYDPSKTLVIDPVLTFSTYYGGTGMEQGFGIAVDPFGNTWVTGITSSANFPIKPSGFNLRGAQDAFILKLKPSGEVEFATFFGGTGNEVGIGVAVTDSGEVCIIGETTSADFPLKSPLQSRSGGGRDVFIAKLSAQGDQLLFSSYLGGQADEQGRGVALDFSGNVWLVGITRSADFPVNKPLQNNYLGKDEGFVAKIGVDGKLLFSTWLGGSGDDGPTSIAVDRFGNAYIAGTTDSTGFRTIPGSVQLTKRNGFDAFIAKIDVSASSILYSTYLGGDADDGASGVAVDYQGNAYVTGGTRSNDYPTTASAFQRTYGGGAALGGDAFVTKLNDKGSDFIYSSYLGGSGPDQAVGIAIDLSGNAYVAGNTASQNFPRNNPLQSKYGGGFQDAFVTRFNTGGSALVYSSFLGGNDFDNAGAIAVDSFRNVYLTGVTLSSDFPLVNPAQSSRTGSTSDLFVARINNGSVTSRLAIVSAASYQGNSLAVESIVAAFGMNLADRTQSASTVPLPLSLVDISVIVTDGAGRSAPAPLFFVSPNQVNFQLPIGLATGTAKATLLSASDKVFVGDVELSYVAPGLFAANGSGQGVAAAVILRVRSDGTQIYEPVARFDSTQNRFVPIPIDLGGANDQVLLVLFGTGFRSRSANTAVSIGGNNSEVFYSGPQGNMVGLDQANVIIPRSLIGRGEVDITMMVDGKNSNTVKAYIR